MQARRCPRKDASPRPSCVNGGRIARLAWMEHLTLVGRHCIRGIKRRSSIPCHALSRVSRDIHFCRMPCPMLRKPTVKFGDHLHCCQQHAGATHNAHEHLLTAVQQCFQQGGYVTERKHVPHSRGLKKADLWVKDFQLAGVRHVVIDTTLRHEFHGNVWAQATLEPRTQWRAIPPGG